MGILIAVILFTTFILALKASTPQCLGCRNKKCLPGTSLCTSKCSEGYFSQITEQSGDSFTCQTCPKFCKACVSVTRCIKCYDGFWGDWCNKTCPIGCKGNICDPYSGHCTSCKTGYFSTVSDENQLQCKKCTIAKCIQCNDKTCEQCEIGWHGAFCNKTCSEGCFNGNCTIDGDCICKQGYFNSLTTSTSYECRKCPKDCVKCTSTRNCSWCRPGYWGHDCKKICSKSCYEQSCDQITSICNKGCSEGFVTLENGTCVDCNITCANCTSGPLCKECEEGGVCRKLGNNGEFRWLMYVLIGLAVLAICFIFTMACLMAKPVICTKNTQNAIEARLFRKRRSTEFRATNQGRTERHVARARVTSSVEFSTSPTPALPERAVTLETLDDGELGSLEIQIEDDEGLYYNTTALHRNQIPILDLQQKVSTMSKADFSNEFMRLPRGLVRPYGDAVKPENEHKNRYLDIYPFDATRVRLKDGPGDYVNASHVEGFRNPNAYIAALGPTLASSEGFSLFWRMVWQEKVEVIVMLTNLMEGPTMKCEKYWPSVQSCVHYGDVIVEGLTESEYDEYVVREFTVSMDNESRKLTHMHFIVWPDKNVPNEERSLVEFRDEVNKIPRDNQQPIVVHCSAGIGRTGTYIALDILMEQGASQQSVDIFGCVAALRGQRVNLVQNAMQYEYIYHALVHVFGRDVMYANVDIYQNVDLGREALVQPIESSFDETEEIVTTEL